LRIKISDGILLVEDLLDFVDDALDKVECGVEVDVVGRASCEDDPYDKTKNKVLLVFNVVYKGVKEDEVGSVLLVWVH
jgi:hypothetical protein